MRWKDRVKQLRAEARVLYLALKDRRTPWYARALAVGIIAYLLSPIDIIPDFIPVLGYLDDLLLVSAGIYLARKMVPREVLEEYRQKVSPGTVSSSNG